MIAPGPGLILHYRFGFPVYFYSDIFSISSIHLFSSLSSCPLTNSAMPTSCHPFLFLIAPALFCKMDLSVSVAIYIGTRHWRSTTLPRNHIRTLSSWICQHIYHCSFVSFLLSNRSSRFCHRVSRFVVQLNYYCIVVSLFFDIDPHLDSSLLCVAYLVAGFSSWIDLLY